MTAVIYHSVSKHKQSERIAKTYEGDHYQIQHAKRPIRCFLFQLMVYGFETVSNKKVKIQPVAIDYDKYDSIVLVAPVWAGRVNAYLRQFLKEHPFQNKKVTLVASCDGGYNRYFDSFRGLIDETNEIVERVVYVKGERTE
jgi:hypothetical protein